MSLQQISIPESRADLTDRAQSPRSACFFLHVIDLLGSPALPGSPDQSSRADLPDLPGSPDR
jgi:hypothetical protein